MSEMLSDNATDFIAGLDNESEFIPYAYYDKHLDCIRVKFFDCSFKEVRKNKIITVLLANHSEQNTFAGFTIKGVRYLFEKMQLPLSGVHKLSDLVDSLVKVFPDESILQVKDLFHPILKEQNLEVELN